LIFIFVKINSIFSLEDSRISFVLKIISFPCRYTKTLAATATSSASQCGKKLLSSEKKYFVKPIYSLIHVAKVNFTEFL